MQDALRGLLVLLQAAEAFRSGPANRTRMQAHEMLENHVMADHSHPILAVTPHVK
jgi:hypothetical protein